MVLGEEFSGERLLPATGDGPHRASYRHGAGEPYLDRQKYEDVRARTPATGLAGWLGRLTGGEAAPVSGQLHPYTVRFGDQDPPVDYVDYRPPSEQDLQDLLHDLPAAIGEVRENLGVEFGEEYAAAVQQHLVDRLNDLLVVSLFDRNPALSRALRAADVPRTVSAEEDVARAVEQVRSAMTMLRAAHRSRPGPVVAAAVDAVGRVEEEFDCLRHDRTATRASFEVWKERAEATTRDLLEQPASRGAGWPRSSAGAPGTPPPPPARGERSDATPPNVVNGP